MKEKYLTKSRFKEGLECLTKLYYTGKINEYANQKIDDPFLQALADGGHQVGMLALYLFSDDPVAEKTLVHGTNYETTLKETKQRFEKEGRATIAKAAFKYDHLFIRADVIVKECRFQLKSVPVFHFKSVLLNCNINKSFFRLIRLLKSSDDLYEMLFFISFK